MRSLKEMRLFAMCAALVGAGCTASSTPNAVPENPDASVNEPDAQSEGEGESESEGAAIIICEDADYARADFDAAYEAARDALATEGYEVVPLTWEDENGFSRLVEHMIAAFGCTPENESSRRFGGEACEVVTDFSEYQSDVAYCGPGARREPCGGRVIPGDCLNEVCYRHDVCYRDLIAAQGPACIWSPDTEICDDDFYAGASACDAEIRCGFRCALITTIAAQLKLLQKTVEVVNDEACVFGDDPDADRDRYSQFADNDCDDANAAINPGATEVCDRADNDCDGAIDNGVLNACGECGPLPDELCDALDNDCDGAVDEGLRNACGVCGPVPEEICNGEDDDCDGQIDEGASDCWIPIAVPDAPSSRNAHTAIWTGSEMIVWGGFDGLLPVSSGGRYDLATGSWTSISTLNAPIARRYHSAVWTGSEMVVWGGWDGSYLNTGGRYNPFSNSWTATSTTGVPTGRAGHADIWTGSEMIVWGGWDGTSRFNTGGRYNPFSNSWTSTSTTGVLTVRTGHTAIWTGSEMVVWGGMGRAYLNTGGRYNPSTNSWTATSTTGVPTGRDGHAAIWTGSEMVVWGGWDEWNRISRLNTGGRYNPETDEWTVATLENAPTGRVNYTAIWTGSEMVVWGGWVGDSAIPINTGGRYNPETDTWTATSTTGVPTERERHTAVWTGSEMIVWGGWGGSYFNTGGRYTPP